MTPAMDAAEAVLRSSASCADGATATDAARRDAISRRRMGRMLSPRSGGCPHGETGVARGISEAEVVDDDAVEVGHEGDRCRQMDRVEGAQRDRVKVSGFGKQCRVWC